MVIFGYFDKNLQILLIKKKESSGQYELPRAQALNNEGLEHAAKRELQEIGIVNPSFVEQLYTFGNINGVAYISYLVLIPPSYHNAFNSERIEWFRIDMIPTLNSMHKKIKDKGLERFYSKIQYQPIVFHLLNKEFLFSELENVYKTIVNSKMDRRNFRKKIMSYHLLDEANKIKKQGIGKHGKLFTFNQEKYKELENNGLILRLS